jgi:hypothetical protein
MDSASSPDARPSSDAAAIPALPERAKRLRPASDLEGNNQTLLR